jgi:hypothetical protein
MTASGNEVAIAGNTHIKTTARARHGGNAQQQATKTLEVEPQLSQT